MNTKKIILAALISAFLIGAYVWFFVYNKAHTNFQEEESAFIGLADELRSKALDDENTFKTAFLNKAVEIKGVVTESGSNTFTLGSGIICTLDPSIDQKTPEMGAEVKVKGRLVGTDEDLLTMELICNLDQCVIIAD